MTGPALTLNMQHAALPGDLHLQRIGYAVYEEVLFIAVLYTEALVTQIVAIYWRVHARRSLLLQYGFWRLVLDEAQLVASSSSVAALMTSALWRRHAWVVTGTPITSRVEEIQVPPHTYAASQRNMHMPGCMR